MPPASSICIRIFFKREICSDSDKVDTSVLPRLSPRSFASVSASLLVTNLVLADFNATISCEDNDPETLTNGFIRFNAVCNSVTAVRI